MTKQVKPKKRPRARKVWAVVDTEATTLDQAEVFHCAFTAKAKRRWWRDQGWQQIVVPCMLVPVEVPKRRRTR